MSIQITNCHTVSRLTLHIFWRIKHRYKVLVGDIQQKSCRKLKIQICDSKDILIFKEVVLKDHIHMHNEYRSS